MIKAVLESLILGNLMSNLILMENDRILQKPYQDQWALPTNFWEEITGY